MNPFFKRIGKIMTRPLFSGTGGASGLGRFDANTVAGLLGLPMVDAERDVGELWKSSIPLSCLKWEQRAAIELDIVVQHNDENGDWVNMPKHRAISLLRNPNPFHSSSQLFDCIRWDYHLDGNAYLYKERSASGKVIALWWVPSWMIDPRWEETGTDFISCYEYRVDGRVFAIDVRDIIHFRNGLDPRWAGRKGLSEFAGTVREVMSDDEAATLVASLMKNSGMPGVIISPDGTVANGGQTFKKEQRDEFREYWDETFTGNGRGRPFMHSLPVKVQFPSYNPQQLVLDKVRAIPEQRIAGAFGLPLSVLQLGSGLVNSNSRANKSDDRKQAYESCIIPTSKALAAELTRSLLSEFGNIDSVRVWFDTSDVSCLEEDKLELWGALEKACGGPFMTPNEARKHSGFRPIDGGDLLRQKAAKGDEKQTGPTHFVSQDQNESNVEDVSETENRLSG